MEFNGKIVLLNRAAEALIAQCDGLVVARRELRAEQPAESALSTKTILEGAAVSSGRSLSCGSIVMVSRRSRAPLQLRIYPIRHSGFPLGGKIAVAVFVTDPMRLRPPQELLRTMYGLTVAESRIALLLSDGHATRKISNIIGVTENTVRTQIKSIYAKTGVKRQAELIRLLVGLAAPVA